MLTKLENVFKKVVEILLAILFLGMIVLVAMQVVGRFLNISMAWAEEMSRYFMVWSIFFGMILLYCEQGHVWVNNLVNAMPVPIRKIMLTVSYLLQVFCFVMIFIGTNALFTAMKGRTSTINHLPLNMVYACVPIAAAFMLIFCIRDIVKLFMGGEKKDA